MARAFVLIIWVAVCGLFVAASLLLPRSWEREAITEAVLEGTPGVARPDVDPRYLPFTDEWRSPSAEDMKKLASRWVAYANDLEAERKMAQLVLQSQATHARRGYHLFWIAFTFLVIVSAGAAWIAASKHQPPESVPVDLSAQVKPET